MHLAHDDGRKHCSKHVELIWNNKLIYIVHLAHDDGLKYRPKHVELTWSNKLIYIVHLVDYFHSSTVSVEVKSVGCNHEISQRRHVGNFGLLRLFQDSVFL